MNSKYLSSRQTTPTVGSPSFVTVTHPYHPLRGQTLEVVRVPQKVNSRLLVRHPDGSTFPIPRDWTDFEASRVEQTEAPSAHLLDIKGLRAIAKIIGNTGTESSVPEKGERGST